MNTPNTNKNIAIYNNQPLDSYSDTIISFEYSRYNPSQTPTGGIAVVFFDNVVDMPREGGPGHCLGYTPSSIITDRCKLAGYKGLAGAILGIGFDSTGKFALQTDMVDGVSLSAFRSQPTIVVRGGIRDNYKLLYNLVDNITLNDIPGLERFTIDKQLSAEDDSNFRAVRIIAAKQFSEITVQLKQDLKQDDFITVFKVNLSDVTRKTFKVGITHTSDDPTTKFLVRNFNVAGFPGVLENFDLIADCQQDIRIDGYVPVPGTYSAMGQEFICVPVGKRLVNYTTDLNRFNLENTIYTGPGVKILGQDTNSVVGKINNSPEVVVYEYLGQKLAKASTIITPDLAEAASADVSDNSLVICTQPNSFYGTPGGIFLYNYISESIDSSKIGTWSLYQTILPNMILSGIGLGNSVQLQGNNLLVGNLNEYIHAFQKGNSNIWEYLQTIYSPGSGMGKFASVMSLEGRDLVVGAPYMLRQNFPTLGQGEAYHFYLSKTTNTWNYIMALGDFYGINTVAGNFGTDVKLSENLCVIGSPGEAYLEPGTIYEKPNVGRAYIFNKTTDGLFTQGTVLAPPSAYRDKYTFYGEVVNAFKNFVSVISPYTPQKGYSYLHVYNANCLFTTPPSHLPVPDCSIGLMDRGGYVIDLENLTYMQNLSCLLNP